MPKKTQKILSLLLSVVLICLVFTACKTDETTEVNPTDESKTTETKQPEPEESPAESQEPVELTILTVDNGVNKVDEDLYVFSILEERIGVKAIPVPILSSEFDEKFNTLLVTRDLPDVLTLPIESAKKYGPAGLFVNFKEDAAQKVPNLLTNLEMHQEVMPLMAADDGGWYAFPAFTEIIGWGWVPGLREDVLDTLGMDKNDIKTLDDLYEYLQVSKGVNKVEYPWIPVRNGSEIITVMPSYYGVGGTEKLFYEDATDSFNYGPLTDTFKVYIEFVRKCYENELMHPDILALSRSENKEMFWAGKAAMFHYPELLIEGGYNNEIKSISGDDSIELTAIWPVEINGETPIPRRDSALKNNGATSRAIYAGSQVIDTAYKYIDYLYSEEGSKQIMLGTEGEHYKVNDNGDFEWLVKASWNQDLIPDAPEYREFGLLNAYYILREPFIPNTPEIDEYYLNFLEEKADKLKDPAPLVALNEVDQEEYAAIMSVVATSALENCSKFVTGERSMDEWDAFVSELQNMNIERAIAIYNDTYNARK